MEIIKIYQGNLIDARELHSFLEIKTEFARWVKRNILTNFEEGKDFSSKVTKSRGRPLKDYFLTISTAKKLAMMAKTKRGDEAREYFLQCEQTLIELKENKRFEAFSKLEITKQKLLDNVEDIGGNHNDYLQIDTTGRKVLFNGDPLPDDELPTILLKLRDFGTELTNLAFAEGLHDLDVAEKLNAKNHNDLRNVMKENTGKLPEELDSENPIDQKRLK